MKILITILGIIVGVLINKAYHKMFHVIYFSLSKVFAEWVVCRVIGWVIVGAIFGQY